MKLEKKTKVLGATGIVEIEQTLGNVLAQLLANENTLPGIDGKRRFVNIQDDLLEGNKLELSASEYEALLNFVRTNQKIPARIAIQLEDEMVSQKNGGYPL